MRLSVKDQPIGKPVNSGFILTHGWNPVNCSPESLLNHLLEGRPFAVAQFSKGYRRSDHFIASDIIALDLDGVEDYSNGQPTQRALNHQELDEVLNHPLVQNHACIVIESASSKPGAYKLRVIFRLTDSVYSPELYKRIVAYLQSCLPYVDPSTKDAGRAFFGGQPNRPALFMNADNTLSLEALLEAVTEKLRQTEENKQKQTKTRQKAKFTTQPASLKDSYSRPLYQKTKEALSHIPRRLSYEQWLYVLMGVHSAFPNQAGIDLIEGWSPGYVGEVAEKFASFDAEGGITLGMVFQLAHEHGYRVKRGRHYTEDFPPKPDEYPNVKVISINADYLSNAELDLSQAKSVLISSPMGTGKTDFIIKNIRKDQRVIFISPRITLANNLTKRLQSAGLAPCLYQDETSNEVLRNARILVITPNSLKRLVKEGELPYYDLVVLDEIQILHEHLMGETFKAGQATQIYKILVNLIRRSAQTILMDAYMGRNNLDWLLKYRDEVTIVHNTYLPPPREMNLYTKKYQLMHVMLNILMKGQTPIAIACDQRDNCEFIHENLKKLGYKGLAIHRGTTQTPEVQAFLKNPDEILQELDYIVYTPTLNVGFDIQAEVPHVFGFFQNHTISTPDQMQMLGRCRKGQTFHVFQTYIINDAITDAEVIRANILANMTPFAKKFNIDLDYDDEGRSVATPTPAQLEFIDIHCDVTARRNYFLNTSYHSFVSLARKYFNVHEVKQPKDESYLQNVKDSFSHIRQERKASIRAIKESGISLSQAEYEIELKRGEAPYYELLAKRELGDLEEFFGSKNLPEYAKLGSSQGIKQSVRNFIFAYHPTADALLEFDIGEIEGRVELHRRSLITMKITVLKQLLQMVYGERLHTEEIPIERLHDLQDTFNEAYWRMNIPRLFGRNLDDSPGIVARLRWILRQFGLKLIQVRHTRKRLVSYQIEPVAYEAMRHLSAMHLAHHGGAQPPKGEMPLVLLWKNPQTQTTEPLDFLIDAPQLEFDMRQQRLAREQKAQLHDREETNLDLSTGERDLSHKERDHLRERTQHLQGTGIYSHRYDILYTTPTDWEGSLKSADVYWSQNQKLYNFTHLSSEAHPALPTLTPQELLSQPPDPRQWKPYWQQQFLEKMSQLGVKGLDIGNFSPLGFLNRPIQVQEPQGFRYIPAYTAYVVGSHGQKDDSICWFSLNYQHYVWSDFNDCGGSIVPLLPLLNADSYTILTDDLITYFKVWGWLYQRSHLQMPPVLTHKVSQVWTERLMKAPHVTIATRNPLLAQAWEKALQGKTAVSVSDYKKLRTLSQPTDKHVFGVLRQYRISRW